MACARTIPVRFDGGRMNFQMPGMLDVWRFEYNGEASLEWAATREVAHQIPVVHTTGRYLENGVLTTTLSEQGAALVEEYLDLQYYWRNHFAD